MRKHINSFCGKFKIKPCEKPFAEWISDLNREEKELEEAKFLRMETRRFVAAEKEIKINWLK